MPKSNHKTVRKMVAEAFPAIEEYLEEILPKKGILKVAKLKMLSSDYSSDG